VTIDRIEVTNHELALDPAFRAAWDPNPRTSFQVTIVRVFDSTGAVGIGSGGTLADLGGYHHLFIGEDPLDLERHGIVIANASFHGGRMWPLDVAIWDLAGQLKGQPVWRMVGGRAQHLRPYLSTGTLRPIADTVEYAQQAVADGFTAIKLRFGRESLDDDFSTLAAVRNTVGTDVKIMVDCNQGWRMPWDTRPSWTLDMARAVGSRLDEFDVYWVEEPLHRGAYNEMATLRSELSARIAGGEMTRDGHEFSALLDHGSLDVYQPDVVLTGGFAGLASLAGAVEAAGAIFTPHTWGNGIGLVANCHLAAGAASPPFIEYPSDGTEWSVHRRDFPLLNPIIPDADGLLSLSDEPGLGLELDEERLASTATSTKTYSG